MHTSFMHACRPALSVMHDRHHRRCRGSTTQSQGYHAKQLPHGPTAPSTAADKARARNGETPTRAPLEGLGAMLGLSWPSTSVHPPTRLSPVISWGLSPGRLLLDIPFQDAPQWPGIAAVVPCTPRQRSPPPQRYARRQAAISLDISRYLSRTGARLHV